MPVIIPKDLPAKAILDKEYIFSMSEERARTQDIRPLRLALVNLMPTKIVTETQFMRLLSNTPLQVDIDLIAMSTHESKNTSKAHLYRFYKTFEDIEHQKYDGMIITGAPVEMLYLLGISGSPLLLLWRRKISSRRKDVWHFLPSAFTCA